MIQSLVVIGIMVSLAGNCYLLVRMLKLKSEKEAAYRNIRAKEAAYRKYREKYLLEGLLLFKQALPGTKKALKKEKIRVLESPELLELEDALDYIIEHYFIMTKPQENDGGFTLFHNINKVTVIANELELW